MVQFVKIKYHMAGVIMKTVEFGQLYQSDFAISELSVIHQTPAWSTLGSMGGRPRKLNGFLLVDSGECIYEWNGGNAVLSKGSLIYLPMGAVRLVTVTARPFSFYRISFNLTEADGCEQILFSEKPFVFTYNAPEKLFDISRELMESTLSRLRIYRSMSLMCEFFHTLAKYSGGESKSRIEPALRYLESHYAENTDVETLARLCFISKPHLFRLFKSELGMSPMEYRNSIRIERAKLLLADGECTVGEIAAMLGFDGSYYFSRLFKAQTGMTPSRYSGG